MNTTPSEKSRTGSQNHSQLVNDILRAIGALPHVRVWKNATGVARSVDDERVITYGLKGSADILGIVGPRGTFLAVEVKTGSGRQRSQQLAFEQMVSKLGGIYILARSVSDVTERVGTL